MMNLPIEAETFGDIPSSSQGIDYQTLLKMDTKELLSSQIVDGNNGFDIVEALLNNQLQDQQNAFKTETKPFATIPDHHYKIPVLEDVSNEWYNFTVALKGQESTSSSWCYSSKLEKLYVKKKNSFTIDVSCRNPAPFAPLRVRVMLVCSSPQDIHRAIFRCQHDISKDNAQLDYIKNHIVRCVNPDANYIGDPCGVAFKDRLAMIIPLQGVGEQLSTPVSLEFLCQNSCPTIERRSTALIFTLENETGSILGRKSISVKICSCPKRDMSKEEGKGGSGSGRRKRDATDASINVEQQPPKKLTRQSSLSGLKPTRSIIASQRESPVPSMSSVPFDRVKKEMPYTALSRSSSNLSSTAAENDSSAIVMTLRLPDIATAVEVVEYAFKHISADMLRCRNEEKNNRLSKFLNHCNRVKRDIKKNTEEIIEPLQLAYDSD